MIDLKSKKIYVDISDVPLERRAELFPGYKGPIRYFIMDKFDIVFYDHTGYNAYGSGSDFRSTWKRQLEDLGYKEVSINKTLGSMK